MATPLRLFCRHLPNIPAPPIGQARWTAVPLNCLSPADAHPATGGTRKPSVPGRVHSEPKSCGCRRAAAPADSNPLLTHGTVESPAKCLEAALLIMHRESP